MLTNVLNIESEIERLVKIKCLKVKNGLLF